MNRLLTIMNFLLALTVLGGVAMAEEKQFPPVPDWQPEFMAPLDDQVDRMIYYTDKTRDLALFSHGTIVILEDGLDDVQAKDYAKKVLSEIFNYHPDMNPLPMDDGNILVQYNHPAYNVVITSFVKQHMDTINNRHLDALATDEVLITGLGQNKFDEFGMMALYGRTFMFMDAQNPNVIRIVRKQEDD